MKTTTRALIDELTKTLIQRVLPAAGDAAHHVRDVLDGLDRLARRIEMEGEIIWLDIADQRLILSAVEQEGRRHDVEPWKGLAAAIAKELDRVWHTPAHYPDMAVLEAENRRLRSLIDRAAEAVAAAPEPLGDKRARQLTKALNDYRKRQAEREAPMNAPARAEAEST